MVENLWAAIKIVVNREAIISSMPISGQNTPLMVAETDFNNLNNEQMMQYIKKL